MTDIETLSVYAERADEYADLTNRAGEMDPSLRAFLDEIPPKSRILDLGCGPGQSAAHMAAAGHFVMAMDAVPEMVRLAARTPGVVTRLGTFDDLAGLDHYDAIWANFSLLHAPRADMPRHLLAITRLLRAGGLFHIGMKLGEGEKRDSLGRLYTYYTQDELEGLLTTHSLTIVDRQLGEDKGLDGTMAPWICLRAHA